MTSLSSVLRTLRRESGQTLVMTTLFMTIILGLAALVIDGGHWLTERRDMQGIADAASLAGARELVSNPDGAEFMARDYVLGHGVPATEIAEIDPDGDSVRVVLNRESNGFISMILGEEHESATIEVDATAQVQQATSMPMGLLPFAVMEDSYTLGDNMQIRDDNSERRGLIYPPQGENCNIEPQGANDVKEMIDKKSPACGPPVGTVIRTKAGWNTGAVNHGFVGVDDSSGLLAGNEQSFEDVFEWNEDMQRYVVLDPDSPRIGYIPIIENLDGSTDWGDKEVRITGYLMVYIGNRDATDTDPKYSPLEEVDGGGSGGAALASGSLEFTAPDQHHCAGNHPVCPPPVEPPPPPPPPADPPPPPDEELDCDGHGQDDDECPPPEEEPDCDGHGQDDDDCPMDPGDCKDHGNHEGDPCEEEEDNPGGGGGGSSVKVVYLTPVQAVLPPEWDVELGDYDADNPAPVVIHLSE